MRKCGGRAAKLLEAFLLLRRCVIGAWALLKAEDTQVGQSAYDRVVAREAIDASCEVRLLVRLR
jgi:hypothetical protein